MPIHMSPATLLFFTNLEADNLKDEPIYHASGSMQPLLTYGMMQGTYESHLLVTAGLSSDTIEQTGQVNPALPCRLLDDWREMLRRAAESQSTDDDDTKVTDRWWRTMIAGRSPIGNPAPNNLRFLAAIFDSSDDPSRPEDPALRP